MSEWEYWKRFGVHMSFAKKAVKALEEGKATCGLVKEFLMRFVDHHELFQLAKLEKLFLDYLKLALENFKEDFYPCINGLFNYLGRLAFGHFRVEVSDLVRDINLLFRPIWLRREMESLIAEARKKTIGLSAWRDIHAGLEIALKAALEQQKEEQEEEEGEQPSLPEVWIAPFWQGLEASLDALLLVWREAGEVTDDLKEWQRELEKYFDGNGRIVVETKSLEDLAAARVENKMQTLQQGEPHLATHMSVAVSS